MMAHNLSRGCAHWVRIEQTKLTDKDGNFLPFAGAHVAITAGEISRGTFVGCYRGKWIRRRSAAPYRGALAPYAMETDDFFIVPQAEDGNSSQADLDEYPMAAVNEVPLGHAANCTFKRFFTERDVRLPMHDERLAQRIDAVALYTTRAVQPGEELLTDYGKHYSFRGAIWTPGAPGRFLSKSEIVPPVIALYGPVPSDAWSYV